MWGQVTAEEFKQVKDQLSRRREAMLKRHAEELSALDSEVASIDTISGLVEDFAQKYRSSPPPQQPTTVQQRQVPNQGMDPEPERDVLANPEPEQDVMPEHEARAAAAYHNLRRAMLGR
jgi:hypothetical protein